jgi:hypothetical protein
MPSVTQPLRPQTLPNGRPAVAGYGSEAPTPPSRDDLLLIAAVREGAARATIAAGLGGLVVIHAVDAVGKWNEARYVFWMYMAAIVAAIVAAGWTVFTRSRTALLASAAVAGGVLLGYAVNRTVGLPGATDDIGNWTEPLGLASLVVEAATVLVATGAYALSGRRSQTW